MPVPQLLLFLPNHPVIKYPAAAQLQAACYLSDKALLQSFHTKVCDAVQVFERETNREKNLEKAVKEAKVKARKEAAKTSDNDKDRALDEQDILKVCSGSCQICFRHA